MNDKRLKEWGIVWSKINKNKKLRNKVRREELTNSQKLKMYRKGTKKKRNEIEYKNILSTSSEKKKKKWNTEKRRKKSIY